MTVEGIKAEDEAAGYLAKNKVRKLLQASFWELLAPRDGACAQAGLGPPTTSSFGARSFCSRLLHSMIVLL